LTLLILGGLLKQDRVVSSKNEMSVRMLLLTAVAWGIEAALAREAKRRMAAKVVFILELLRESVSGESVRGVV
jgi:hypothetical protein